MYGKRYLSCRDVETEAQDAVAFWRGQLVGGGIRAEFGLACLQQCGLLSVLTDDPLTRDSPTPPHPTPLVLLAFCCCLSGCRTCVQDLSMNNPGQILPVYPGQGSHFSSCYLLATVAASVMGVYGDCDVPGSGCLYSKAELV